MGSYIALLAVDRLLAQFCICPFVRENKIIIRLNMSKSNYFRIDLEEYHNEQCRKCSNAQERDEHLRNDLCITAKSKLDSLPLRCIGSWGYQKIYRLVQYFGIFSKGMHKKWPVLN